VERAAASGNPTRFALPRPMLGRKDCHFSFSGLKTAVRQAVATLPVLDQVAVQDVAASFQAAVTDVMADRLARAITAFRADHPEGRHVVVAGGVAANQTLRRRLTTVSEAAGLSLLAPPLWLCTDNAAMIAWAGIERLRLGLTDPLDAAPRPRWPLDPAAAPAAFAGVKA
jgi:N6-L-threonylcarbamoyladenine synthase